MWRDFIGIRVGSGAGKSRTELLKVWSPERSTNINVGQWMFVDLNSLQSHSALSDIYQHESASNAKGILEFGFLPYYGRCLSVAPHATEPRQMTKYSAYPRTPREVISLESVQQ